MSETKNYKQGKDDRQNCQKPEKVLMTTKGKTLTVYCGLGKTSGVYYEGKKEGYKNGATWNHYRKDNFVGDDSSK